MPDKLSRQRLEDFLTDIRLEPQWRQDADREAAYYDGRQLDQNLIDKMEERGIPPLHRNLIGPTIDLVLGMEAKSKRDWKVIPDREEYSDVAEALNVEIKKAERACNADQACSDAYASQVKVGVGWVEVARESDPFKPRHRCKNIHRREIFWDWRASEMDLSDARFMVRRRWFDLDALKVWFPKHKTLLERSVLSRAEWESEMLHGVDTGLMTGLGVDDSESFEELQWRDTERRRLCLYEVWYRHWIDGFILRLPDGRVVQYDESNLRHAMLVANDVATIESAKFPVIRLSWWVGPNQLADIPSPYPHNRFPYVPFWGIKEDETGIPYGLIRRMMSPQDEVNARLSKMMWLLSAKRIIADSDAADQPWSDIIEEAARPDAVILMNPNRRNKTADALRVESDFDLSRQQFDVLKDATQAIQDAAGVYQAMLGKSGQAESGIAINSLVEQGATTLAEINDNYRYARKLVGELLLSLVREDLGSKPHSVTVQANGQRRTIRLNEPTISEEGYTYLSNSIALSRLSVELEDVPDTPSYKMQQFQTMAEIIKSLPAELQPYLVDFMIMASNMPNRQEAADRIRKQLGIDKAPEDMSPEELAAAQQQQQMAEAEQQLLMQEQQAKVGELNAKIQKLLAEVENLRARSQETLAKAEATEQELVQEAETHAIELSQDVEPDAPTEREKFNTDVALRADDQQFKQRLAQDKQKQDFQLKKSQASAASRFRPRPGAKNQGTSSTRT